MSLLQFIYCILAAIVAGLLVSELLRERNWRPQLAIVMVLLPLVLRVLQIK